MLDSVRRFVTDHNDASKVVREARRFSVRLPLVGKVTVPPPQHLAFYTVLGALAATEVIPWPVAVGVGVGHALTVRTDGDAPGADARAPQPAEPARRDGPTPAPEVDLATTS